MAVPIALEEVEQLVLRMLQPGSPAEIHELDSRIRAAQRSVRGWEIANYLLGCASSQVRYFGALTFQIKINSDSNTLGDEDITSVGQQLIGWLITLLGSGEGKMVLQKLCSTLAVYYLLPRDTHADICVRNLLASFSVQAPTKPDDVQSLISDSIRQIIERLDHDRLIMALWFCRNLTEEASKKTTGYPPDVVASTLSHMSANLPDVVALMKHCLTVEESNSEIRTNLRSEALSCFLSCALFAQPTWPSDQESLAPLRSLLEPAITWCAVGDSDKAMEILSELLSSFGSFFQKGHLRMMSALLTSPWAEEHLKEALEEPEEGVSPFARLALAYGEVTVKELVTDPENPTNRGILSIMHSLLRCPGYAAIDDQVVVHAQEFWTTYIEFLVDSEFEEETSRPWLEQAKEHVMQLYHEVWAKVRFPTQSAYAIVDSDTQREFRQFRADMKELLLSAFPTVQSALTETIARMCLDSLAHQQWLDVEASLFCLIAIAVSEHQSEDHILASLFGSQLYIELSRPDSEIPARTRRTAVDLLGQYADFFERHTEYLPAALDFLFSSLTNASLTQQAARSIFSLCSSCRTSLSSKLGNFVHGYEQFLNSPTADRTTKERVIGGIAAIVQALPSDLEKVNWLGSLLDFVQRDISLAVQHCTSGLYEEGQVEALTAMGCLASVGKASQAPDDAPIDLDSDAQVPDFWHSGEGVAIQGRICEAVRIVMQLLAGSTAQGQMLELHGDILETICTIFKAGFAEAVPGPFVLPAQVVVDFFSTTQLNTPRLDVVLTMTCAFLRSHSISSSVKIDKEAGALLQHLVGIIRSLEDPRSEAEIASGLIEVITRFMPRYINVLLGTLPQPDLELLFNFPLLCLGIPEYLPKRTAAQFWSAFLALKGSSSTAPQELLDQVLEHFGPKLATALLDQVAGNAMRTDLDWFAEPLKLFCTRHRHAKKWLELALESNDIPSRADSATRLRFLKQLSVANSVNTTKRVITAFWSQCKGLNGAYAP